MISLGSLDIRNNSIADKGLVALAHAFVDNATLQQLLIWGNNFGQPAIDALANQYYTYAALVIVISRCLHRRRCIDRVCVCVGQFFPSNGSCD